MPKPLVRRALLLAAAGMVLTSAAVVPTAYANEASSGAAAGRGQAGEAQVSSMAAEMSDTTAGGYRDSSGALIVNVTDDSAARKAQRAGAKARKVRFSGSKLRASEATLNRVASIAGTSWVIDPVTNQVVVSADSSVTGAKLAKLQRAVAQLGGTVRMEKVAGTFSTTVTGGDPIFAGRVRCSLGFNVKRGADAFFLTAGHCVANGNVQWFADQGHQQVLGSTVSGSFPGDDFGLVKYASNDPNQIPRPGAFRLANGQTRDIVRAGDAVVGQQVERSGSTSGVHSGQVTAVNATVNYPEGQVTGLIRTTVCAEPGDSGGALVAGNVAIGLTSGGSGDCTRGGTTFFQPVTEPLQKFGVQIY